MFCAMFTDYFSRAAEQTDRVGLGPSHTVRQICDPPYPCIPSDFFLASRTRQTTAPDPVPDEVISPRLAQRRANYIEWCHAYGPAVFPLPMSTILQEDSDNMTKDFATVAKEWLAEETLSMQRKYLASCDHPNLSFGLIPLDQALRVDLALATRIWCCAICHMILFWPTVLAHPCARNPRSSALAVNLYIDSLRDVDSVIKACGKDPATILVADMDFCPSTLR